MGGLLGLRFIHKKPKVYVVGDIHGCVLTLKNLIKKIPYKNEDLFVFLGDYIDRGKRSKEVIDFLFNFSILHNNSVFLMGNHEYAFLYYLEKKCLLLQNIQDTISSYKDESGVLSIPESHKRFFKKLKSYYFYDDYFFVHGGIEGKPLFMHRIEELIQIRQEISEDGFEKFKEGEKRTNNIKYIVHGHTPKEEVNLTPFSINIDTNCGRLGRKLTCLELTELKLYQEYNHEEDFKVSKGHLEKVTYSYF